MNPVIPPCKFPWSRIMVYANGDFKHCCYMSKPVGNINDGSFSEVWNNPNSQRVREALLKGELDEEFCICVNTVGHIPNGGDADPHVAIDNKPNLVTNYVQLNVKKQSKSETKVMKVMKDGLYCNGGSSWFSISSEGDVYKCNALIHSKDGSVGNIFTDELNVTDEKFNYCPIQQCQQVCDRHWSQKQIVKNGIIVDRQDIVDRKHYNGKTNPASILWAPSWKCNYTCKYCLLPKGHKEYGPDKWIDAFGKFLDLNKIDGGILHTNGGEPMFYKGILDIFQYMVQCGFVIAITTNLSIDIHPLIEVVPAGGIADISASLHVTDKNFSWKIFKERVVTLHELGYRITVNFVAHPDYVSLIPEYHNFFTTQHGIEFCVIPMIGGWSGVEFASVDEYPPELHSILKKYVKEDLQDDNRFQEGNRIVQSLPVIKQPPVDTTPAMNTIRTAGYNFSKNEINPIMTKELFDFIEERSKIYNPGSDLTLDWLQNRKQAIKERNGRNIKLTCKPLYLDIELNNMCNLRCEFCTCVHGHIRDSGNPNATLTKEEIDKISYLFKWAEIIETSKGGEPFVVPDLFIYALEKMRSINPFAIIHTVTNGTILPDDLLKSLIVNRLDHMYISISGDTQERYKKVMGGDKFNKVISNLEKIQKTKSSMNTREPFLHFNTQLTKYNDPIAILEMADRHGVIEVNFIKTQMTLGKFGNENFKGSPVQDYMTEDEINKMMNLIVKKANELKISVNFPGWAKRNDKIIGSPEKFYYPHVTKYFDLDLTCPTDAPWFRFCTAMRKVQPCCWSGPFSDWITTPFEEIWNGQYLQDLRLQLGQGEYPDVCHCRY